MNYTDMINPNFQFNDFQVENDEIKIDVPYGKFAVYVFGTNWSSFCLAAFNIIKSILSEDKYKDKFVYRFINQDDYNGYMYSCENHLLIGVPTIQLFYIDENDTKVTPDMKIIYECEEKEDCFLTGIFPEKTYRDLFDSVLGISPIKVDARLYSQTFKRTNQC